MFPSRRIKYTTPAMTTNAMMLTIVDSTGNHIISLSCFKSAHDSRTIVTLALNFPMGSGGTGAGADTYDGTIPCGGIKNK
jgi:hypothetical protein